MAGDSFEGEGCGESACCEGTAKACDVGKGTPVGLVLGLAMLGLELELDICSVFSPSTPFYNVP